MKVIAWMYGVWFALVVVGLCGWIMNIVAILHSSFDPLSAMVVLRCIGVFVAPLGAVLGFIG